MCQEEKRVQRHVRKLQEKITIGKPLDLAEVEEAEWAVRDRDIIKLFREHIGEYRRRFRALLPIQVYYQISISQGADKPTRSLALYGRAEENRTKVRFLDDTEEKSKTNI